MAGIAVSYRLNTGCEPSFTWQVESLLSTILAERNLKPIRFVFEARNLAARPAPEASPRFALEAILGALRLARRNIGSSAWKNQHTVAGMSGTAAANRSASCSELSRDSTDVAVSNSAAR